MDAKIGRVQSAAAMLRFTWSSTFPVAWLVLVACGGDASTARAIAEPYRTDIANLCDVVARSGADQPTAGARTYTTATWLAANLATQEARDYLVRIQPLTGEAKVAALDAEARRVGLGRCALADEWRAALPGAPR